MLSFTGPWLIVMKKLQFGKSKASRFFSGKGFYAALALSLVAVGAAVCIAMNQTVGKLTNDGEITAKKNTSSSNEWGFPQNVDINQSDIPITSSRAQSSSKSGNSSKTSSVSAASGTASSNSKVTFVMPLNGTVLNAFSNGDLVKSKTLNEWRTHDGIDIKAEKGTVVKSCAAGTVSEVKEDPLWGVCVTITHGNGYVSYYYGLDKTVKVSKNQTVDLNETIGAVGDTAIIETAEETHLHFALKQNNKWVDPTQVIKKLK